MSLLDKTKLLLQKHGVRPRKKLGQNFCIDSDLLKRLVEYSGVDGDDLVLEIGAGLGFLTELLSKMAKEVIAVEIDSKLTRVLREELLDCKNVKVVEGDILKTALPPLDVIVANPPYSISSNLIPYILEQKFKRAVLTLQDEFVDRLTARQGSSEYGNLAVMAYFKAEIKILEKIPPNSFYPQPEVTSRLVLIELRSSPFNVVDERFFLYLVKMLFTQRNKSLRNALEVVVSKRLDIKKSEARTLIEDFPCLDLKVYEVKPEDFGVVSNSTYNIVEGKRISFEGRVFYVFPQVYEPSDDTFMLAEHVKQEKCRRVLDVCTGCGILGILLAEKAGEAVLIDVNPQAVECARLNTKLNGVTDKVTVLHGDLFEGVTGKFDLITCNPPYLLGDGERSDLIAKAWNGGPDGRRVIDRFLEGAPRLLEVGGKILLVQSSLSNPEETVRRLEQSGLNAKILIEESFEFEKLTVIQAIREG